MAVEQDMMSESDQGLKDSSGSVSSGDVLLSTNITASRKDCQDMLFFIGFKRKATTVSRKKY